LGIRCFIVRSRCPGAIVVQRANVRTAADAGRRSGSDSSRAISRKQSSKLNDADRQFAGSMNSDRRRTDTQTHGQCSSSSLSLSLFLSCNRFIEATRVDREMTNRMRTHFTVICSDRQRFGLKPLCSNRNTSIRYNNNNNNNSLSMALQRGNAVSFHNTMVTE